MTLTPTAQATSAHLYLAAREEFGILAGLGGHGGLLLGLLGFLADQENVGGEDRAGQRPKCAVVIADRDHSGVCCVSLSFSHLR